VILAIDSASTDVSVALATPEAQPLAVVGWTSGRGQGHELLPRLLALLDAQGVALRDISAVAVGTGPGSFTGLRVGMSVAKGLAMALALPIVGVPSLPAWLEADPECDAALTRAGARDAYLLLRGADTIAIVDRDDLSPTVRSATVAAAVELAAAFDLERARPPHGAATATARAAAARLAEAPGGDDLARLEPVYVRAPRGLGQVEQVETIRWL
jgi:tRNA threonylcarbamoyladenosine biosynthesis protein TsaB